MAASVSMIGTTCQGSTIHSGRSAARGWAGELDLPRADAVRAKLCCGLAQEVSVQLVDLRVRGDAHADLSAGVDCAYRRAVTTEIASQLVVDQRGAIHRHADRRQARVAEPLRALPRQRASSRLHDRLDPSRCQGSYQLLAILAQIGFAADEDDLSGSQPAERQNHPRAPRRC
jgi:hypothetical protein